MNFVYDMKIDNQITFTNHPNQNPPLLYLFSATTLSNTFLFSFIYFFVDKTIAIQISLHYPRLAKNYSRLAQDYSRFVKNHQRLVKNYSRSAKNYNQQINYLMDISTFRPAKPSNDFSSQEKYRNHKKQQKPILTQEKLDQKDSQFIIKPKIPQFTPQFSQPQQNSLLTYYHIFKTQIDYLFIVQQPSKLWDVVKLCQHLHLERNYFAMQKPHLVMAITEDEMQIWAALLQNITGSYIEGLTLANIGPADELAMTKGIAQKMFPSLKHLIFSTNTFVSLEFVSFIDAPQLQNLDIYDSHITLLKPLAKTNNTKLHQIMVSKSYANNFNQLSRMKFDKSKSNLVQLCFWAVRSDKPIMNEINSFQFMYKLQSNSPIESISKCLQIYNKKLKAKAKMALRVTGRQANLKPKIMLIHEMQFCKRFKPKKYKELLKNLRLSRDNRQ